jgi:predicted outer membrane protein
MNINYFSRLVLLLLLNIAGTAAEAQVIDPQRSAQAAARNDADYISTSIEDNQAFMFLAQMARERGSDERVKEVAEQMTESHTAMLYAMDQLATSGTGSSARRAPAPTNQQAIALNQRLATRSAMGFDTMWVSNVAAMMQTKYDELVQHKETVTNPRLKMAVTEAIPQVRKNLSQLKSIQKYLTRLAAQKAKER